MLRLGSSRCKLVRDPLNLARDLTELERIVGLHGCERGSLAPPTVEQLPSRGHSITVMGFRILGDLQQDLGKTQGRPPAYVAHCSCESFGRPPGLPLWPGLKPLPVMPPCRVVSWLFSAMFMGSSIDGDAVDTTLPAGENRPGRSWVPLAGRSCRPLVAEARRKERADRARGAYPKASPTS